jgi:hypothetical protein
MMKRTIAAAVAALACTPLMAAGPQILPAQPGGKMMVRQAPVYERVATADVIVLGKVASLEKKDVAALAAPNAAQKAMYRIASVKVSKHLQGAKGLTEIRVGFIAPRGVNRPVDDLGPIKRGGIGGGAIRPHIRPLPYVQPGLTVGQEGIFFLTKHFDESFYLTTGFPAVLEKKSANFAKDLKHVQRSVKLLEKPLANLKAKDRSDRLLTAALLIFRYRAWKPGMTYPIKTEAVAAKESMLVLETLAKADWAKPNDAQPESTQLHPLMLFYRLGVTAKDGWTPPQVKQGEDYFTKVGGAAKKWVKDNAGKYQIQRYLAPSKKKAQKAEK